MSTIYMIDGKPHRVCDCQQLEPICPRDGHQRTAQTCGYAGCFVPAPDVVTTQRAEEAPTQDALKWAAQWIEDSAKGLDESVVKFAANMAMTLRSPGAAESVSGKVRT